MCIFEHRILVEQMVYPTILQCEWHSQHETLDQVQEVDLEKYNIQFDLWIISIYNNIPIIILPAMVRVTVVEFSLVPPITAAVQCISVLLVVAVVALIPIEMLNPDNVCTLG